MRHSLHYFLLGSRGKMYLSKDKLPTRIPMHLKSVRIFILLCLALASWFQARAQESYYRHFDLADGLPSMEVYYAYQDSRDFMWFCTDRGVLRYDGRNFENLSAKAQVPDQTIFEVHEDQSGNLIFSTITGRIYGYQYSTGIFQELEITQDFKQELSAQKSYLGFDSQGQVVVAKHQNGIYTFPWDQPQKVEKQPFDPNINTLVVKELRPGKFVSTWYERDIEMIAQGQVTLFNRSDNLASLNTLRVEFLDGTISEMPLGLTMFRHNELRYIYPTKDGRLLLSVGNQVLLLDDRKVISRLQFKGLVTGFHYSQQSDQLVVAFNKRKVQAFQLEGDSLKAKAVLLDGVFGTHPTVDREGGLWVPTVGSGLYYFPHEGRVKEWKHYPDRLSLLDHEAFGSYHFMSFEGGPLYRMHEDRGFKLLSSPDLETGKVSRVGHVSEGLVLVKSDDFHGKFSFSYPEFEYQEMGMFNMNSNPEFSVLVDGPWILQVMDYTQSFFAEKRHYKLIKYNYRTKQVKLSDPIYRPTKRITDFCRWNDRYYWGSPDGLYSVDTNLQGFRRETMFEQRVQHLVSGEDLWIATRNQGVFRFTKGGELQTFDQARGLLDNLCNGLYMDPEGRVWISTARGVGLIQKSPSDLGQFEIIDVTAKLGIEQGFVQTCFTHKGRLWMFGQKGFFMAPLRDVFKAKAAYNLVLSELRINQKEQSPLALNRLKYNQNFIDFSVHALSFISPGPTRLRYRLDGLSQQWIETSHDVFSFTDLSPGKYALEVQQLQENNCWSDSQVLSTFNIIPAWWQSIWFKLISALLVLGLLYGVIRWRLNQNFHRRMLAGSLVEAQRKAFALQMNPHFLFNALNSLQKFITYKENQKASKFLAEVSNLLRQVINNSESTYISLKEEIDAVDSYLTLEKQRFGDRLDFDIKVEASVDVQKIKVAPLLIQPLVENAIWHGIMPLKEGGRVDIHVYADELYLYVEVEDNGIGRVASKKMKSKDKFVALNHTSIGLRNTRERILLESEQMELHGDLTIVDLTDLQGVSKGTKVVLKYPLITQAKHENINR